jgi:Na+/H+-dicarboxylate symporter
MVHATPPVTNPWYLKLHYQVISAMLLGTALGAGFGAPAVSAAGWMGTTFLEALRMVIVPLVFTSLTSGVASIGTGRELGRIGAKTLGYFALSSFLAIFVGLFFVNLIRPGVGADISGIAGAELPEIERPRGPWELLLGLLLDFIPRNPVQAMTEGDMLGIIGFSILLGIAIAHAPGKIRDGARRGFDVAFQVMMVLTRGVMFFLPFGVLGLMTKAAGESGIGTFVTMGKYALTIALGLAAHTLVVLPLLLFLLGRINPLVHYRNMVDALITAFSTSSSGATLPITLRCVEERVGVSNRITSFIIPMGATVNMDGTALYECAGVIFIAQVLGFPLDLSQQATIVIMAFAASVGAAAIPSAGLVMILIVLQAIGLATPEAMVIVGIMLAIDRPLDMFRTMVNVLSDSCGAAIVARSEGEPHVDAA